MRKYADLILCLGVIIFFLGGILLALNLISGNSPLLPVMAVLAMILIGLAGFLKKKARG